MRTAAAGLAAAPQEPPPVAAVGSPGWSAPACSRLLVEPEAFASLDFQAGRVYWGANWMGKNELELYQATLCSKWWIATTK